MYNLSEMQAANGAFWSALRTEIAQLGITKVPANLDYARRPVPALIEGDTLFTQICGYPLQTIYRGQAVLLGAPVYTAAQCGGGGHHVGGLAGAIGSSRRMATNGFGSSALDPTSRRIGPVCHLGRRVKLFDREVRLMHCDNPTSFAIWTRG